MNRQLALSLDRWLTTPPDVDEDCPYHAAGWDAALSTDPTRMPDGLTAQQGGAWIDGFVDCLQDVNERLRRKWEAGMMGTDTPEELMGKLDRMTDTLLELQAENAKLREQIRINEIAFRISDSEQNAKLIDQLEEAMRLLEEAYMDTVQRALPSDPWYDHAADFLTTNGSTCEALKWR